MVDTVKELRVLLLKQLEEEIDRNYQNIQFDAYLRQLQEKGQLHRLKVKKL